MGQPFGSLPQGLAWATHGGLHQPTLLTQNPIFIRGPQPEGMIFQASTQQTNPTQTGVIFISTDYWPDTLLTLLLTDFWLLSFRIFLCSLFIIFGVFLGGFESWDVGFLRYIS